MAVRKKPQQQLASYFDELLTELNDEIGEKVDIFVAENASIKSEKAKNSSTQSHDIAEAMASKRDISFIDTSHKPFVETATHSIPVAEPKLQSATAPQQQASKPVEKVQLKERQLKETGQKERQQALAKIQQAKLQRLLHSLAPSVEATTPEDQAALAKNFVAPLPETTVKTLVDIGGKEVELATEVSEARVQGWQPLENCWLDNGRPVWAQESFDVLLFSVQGIDLAVPLAALDSIYPMQGADDLTPLFGQAEWFLGLQPTLTGRKKVIDTARFLMPERYQKSQQEHLQFSIALNDSGWSLAVEDVNQPKIVSPETVRWRVNRHKRPWVAGTLKDEMCILLDIPCLIEHLQG